MLSRFTSAFTKIFPVPKILHFNFVGVDLSLSSVRVMQLKKTRFGMVPWRYKEYPLKEKCGLFDASPSEENCTEMAQVLRRIAKEFKVQYVNVSIPENKTYIYNQSVPRSAETKLAQTLLFSVGENIPLGPEEALIDPFVLRKKKDEIDVVVSAIPKNIIDLYTGFFERAGLRLIAFEPETHATSRGIVKKGDKNPYLVLNIGDSLTTITVIEDGLVQYTQTLLVSLKDFQNGFDGPASQNLKEAINKVIIYWFTSRTKQTEDKIQNMYLVGSGGGSNDLINFLEKNLSLNVEFANVWINCFDLDDYIPGLHAKDSLKYATAVGLSLKELK